MATFRYLLALTIIGLTLGCGNESAKPAAAPDTAHLEQEFNQKEAAFAQQKCEFGLKWITEENGQMTLVCEKSTSLEQAEARLELAQQMQEIGNAWLETSTDFNREEVMKAKLKLLAGLMSEFEGEVKAHQEKVAHKEKIYADHLSAARASLKRLLAEGCVVSSAKTLKCEPQPYSVKVFETWAELLEYQNQFDYLRAEDRADFPTVSGLYSIRSATEAAADSIEYDLSLDLGKLCEKGQDCVISSDLSYFIYWNQGPAAVKTYEAMKRFQGLLGDDQLKERLVAWIKSDSELKIAFHNSTETGYDSVHKYFRIGMNWTQDEMRSQLLQLDVPGAPGMTSLKNIPINSFIQLHKTVTAPAKSGGAMFQRGQPVSAADVTSSAPYCLVVGKLIHEALERKFGPEMLLITDILVQESRSSVFFVVKGESSEITAIEITGAPGKVLTLADLDACFNRVTEAPVLTLKL